MLGIVCDTEVAIYRTGASLAQAAQTYLTFGKDLKICRPLSQVAAIAGKTSEELTRELTQLHAQDTPNKGYGISYELNPLSKQEIKTALKCDPFVLLNPIYTDAEKFQLSDLPVQMERTDFNVTSRWKPKGILNFGAHSKIVNVSDESGKTACLKESRYLNDPDQDKRIAHEAQILRDIYQTGLWKAGIPRVVDSGEGWSVLEYVPGYPARDLLRQFPISTNMQHRGIERNIRLEIARQVTETIKYLHTKCTTAHGDITLDNIMMEMTPNGPKATVVDFEHAKHKPSKEDAQKDNHILHETVYEILTGEPSTGMDMASLQNKLLSLGIFLPVAEGIAECITSPVNDPARSGLNFSKVLDYQHPGVRDYKTTP